MNRLLQRMASPVSRVGGLLLALLAVIMTSAYPVATLWFALAAIDEGYDYAVTGVVNSITAPLTFLGVIPLLFATVSLIGRPVKPAWLMPVAVALALCQPIVTVLSIAQIVTLDIPSALLLAIATGCSAGVVAAGLVGVDRSSPVGEVLLIAVAVSITVTAFGGLLALLAITIAILLAITIRRSRSASAVPVDAPPTRDD